MRLALSKVTIIGAFLLALSGCAASRPIGTNTSEQTQVRVIEHTQVVPVFVNVPIPEIRESRTTRDSLSHLENEYAESTAKVNRDGSLYHDLNTKPQTKKAKAEVKIEYRDSIVYKDRIVEKEVEKKVEKELTWWQATKVKFGGWAFGIILLAIIAFIVRIIIKFKP